MRELQRFHVRADGSYTQYLEQQMRVETKQAVQTHSELRLYYNAALEDLEVLEAYTLQPDGSRITVQADRIRTQEAVEDAMYSDDKVRVIIYPQVRPGSQLVLRASSVVHTPLFPGHFYWVERFSPHSERRQLPDPHRHAGRWGDGGVHQAQWHRPQRCSGLPACQDQAGISGRLP